MTEVIQIAEMFERHRKASVTRSVMSSPMPEQNESMARFRKSKPLEEDIENSRTFEVKLGVGEQDMRPLFIRPS